LDLILTGAFYMAKQDINIGVEGNDGTGDSIRESFRKTNENFNELYAVIGEGGQISLTDLSGIAIESFENFPSTDSAPVLAGINNDTQGSELEFFRLVSDSFVDPTKDDSIEFDVSRIDDDGRPVIVVKNKKASLSSDPNPTLSGNLNLGGKIAYNTANPSLWKQMAEDDGYSEDDVLIDKGFADQTYLKSTGSGTGSQLRVRTEDEVNTEDYTYTIASFDSSGRVVINNRFQDGALVVGEGHGLDSAANGAPFVYGTTGTSAIDTSESPSRTLTDTAEFPETKFYIRVVNDTTISLHPTEDDATAGTDALVIAGGSGTQTLKDYYYQPDDLYGDFLANEAIPRESAVRRQGDKMDGPLYLEDHPGELAGIGAPNGLEDYQAATKFYVDNTSFASNINLFVSTSGDDTQASTPPGKEGRSLAYAFRTVNAAARKAELIVEASPVEPGPYMQVIEYGANAASLQPSKVYSAEFDPTLAPDYTDPITGATGEKLNLLVNKNKQFVVAETIAWVAKKIADANADLTLTESDDDFIWKNFAYNEAICARDLGYIIDAARLDTLSGTTTNKLSRTAGLRYFSNASGVTAAVNQKAQTIAAINKAKDILESFILSNTTYTDSLQSDYNQYYDVSLEDAPSSAIDVYADKFDIVTSIINSEGEAIPALREGAPFIVKITNGGNDSVWQGQLNNTDLIPGKIVTGSRSGAVARIVSYDRDANDGTNTDTLELILEEPFEFLVDGAERDIQNTQVADTIGDTLEFGNYVSTKQVTIRVESGIYYEDYPIKVSSQVSVVGDEMRRAIIRPRNRVSQSKWANTYFYRDKYFDGLTLHNNTVTYEDEAVLTLTGGSLTAYKGDKLTQDNTFTYDESKCRRDLEYILEAAGFDIAFGTNYNAITQGLAYQRDSASVVQTSQLSQELAAVGFAGNKVALLDDVADNSLALARSESYFDTVLDIIENGDTNSNEVGATNDITSTLIFPEPDGVDSNRVAARDKLRANRAFIQNEVDAHIRNDYAYPGSPDFAVIKLQVGYWVDALTYDLLYGGNEASTTQARLYFTDGSLNVDNDNKLTIAEAADHFSSIISDILTGTPITKATGNADSQDTTGENASSSEGSEAAANLQIIENAVANNTLPSSPTQPSVTWSAISLRDAKTDIDNNLAETDTSINIVDLTIEFIDSNTGVRATILEDVTNSTSVAVRYDDGYNPAGADVSASSPFNNTDPIVLNGVEQTGVTVSSIDTTNTVDYDMGWHYASDSTKPVNTNSQLSIDNKGGRDTAAEILRDNKINIQEEVYDWMDLQATAAVAAGFGTWAQVEVETAGPIAPVKGETLTQVTTGVSGVVKDDPVTVGGQTTFTLVSPTGTFNLSNELIGSTSGALGVGSVPTDLTVGKFTFTTKCYRDIGYIVDALVYDLVNGRNDQSMEVQGKYYEGAVETGQEEITSQAIGHIKTIASSLLNTGGAAAPTGTTITSWKLGTTVPQEEAGASGVVDNLIDTIVFAFNAEYNPPKNNKDMDVFLMNDATIIRNCTVQGHGGFMTVLDPAGQILTKSPYIQTGSSFSQSVNEQAFRGGMFVDGFNGNMPIEIIEAKNGDPFRLYARSKRAQTQVLGVGVGHGLFVRRPQLPAPFYVNGIRYQVNSIVNHDIENGTAELILDKNSGVRDGNDNGTGWLGPVTSYTRSGGVKSPVYGETTNYPTILQTAGNRSQLGNDFTQINDLGYGLLVTNTGLSEMVGMFTYYCHAAYYANNGSEIRSVGGSNAYGNFGLVAAGSDPNEVPAAGALAYDTVQTAKVYVNDSAQFSGAEEQSYVYVYDTDFIPLPEGEIDITFEERQAIKSLDAVSAEIEITGHGYNTGEKVTISDSTFTNSVSLDGVNVVTSELTVTGHPFSTGDRITVSGSTGVTNLNDDHFVRVTGANTFTIHNSSAGAAGNTDLVSLTGTWGSNGTVTYDITSALNGDFFVRVVDTNSFTIHTSLSGAEANTGKPTLSGTWSEDGVVYPADEEGTLIGKFEVVNVVSAYSEDGVPAVNQQVLTLSDAVSAYWGDTVTQENSGAVGSVAFPQRTAQGADAQGNPIIIGGTELIITQADGATAFNLSDNIKIERVWDGEETTEYADGITITNIDSSGDTSGLPLEGGNGTVWKLSFSNQTNDENASTGGLTYPVFGGESVTIRQRAKFMIDNIDTLPARPSTALLFEESDTVYRTLSFDEKPVTTFGDTADQALPDGYRVVLFDANYDYITPTVGYDYYESQVKLTIEADIGSSVETGDSVTQGSASGVVNLVSSNADGNTVLYVTEWNGTSWTTSGGDLTINGSSVSSSTPTEVIQFSASNTFGATAGDTLIALTSPIADDDSQTRISNGDMIFGWKDRVHTVLGYHDGEGNSYPDTRPTSLETGFPYIEIDPTPKVDKNTQANPTPPSTGIARPVRLNHGKNPVRLSIGIPADEAAEITVNISLTRATGHDFSNIGTGGFNTTNYPNVILGEPANGKTKNFHLQKDGEELGDGDTTAQVWERNKGRVFYMSTDEDGFFRVGKFFEVDQGTGTVKFEAQINISGLDGLGFRDGETISKFTGDSGMTPVDNSTVPTSYSVEQYIDRRLGWDRNMNKKAATLGDGFLPQKNPILTPVLDVDQNPVHYINMQNGRVIQLNDPVDDLDATNKQYVDNRIFSNDEIQELADVELNDIDYAHDYGKNDLIMMTGNKRVYVSVTGTGQPENWRIGQLITGTQSQTAAYIEDLEQKTLDNGVEVWILTYRPRQIVTLTTSGANGNLNDEGLQRGYYIRQANTGARGYVLWSQDQSSTNDAIVKTQGNEVQLIEVEGTFSTNAADVLTLEPLVGTDVVTTVYPTNVVVETVRDFENEKIENSDGAYGQTTGGSDGAPVTTMLEFANASEQDDEYTAADPGDPNRSDINIELTRVRGTQNAGTGDITDGGRALINLQLQDEAVIDSDVNNEADIQQSKLLMNNAPVLSSSAASFEDASKLGQRTKQASQGLAAFDSSTFAEDQIWTLTGSGASTFIGALSVGDIIRQGSSTIKEAYVVKIINAAGPYKLTVRTADTFATGNAIGNRLTQVVVNELDFTKDVQSQSTVTIDSILNTGYINIKDRGITYDKIQEMPEKTVIGRADVDYDGGDEGGGENGIVRAIPFSTIVDQGGALQDKDFNESQLVTTENAVIITTNYEFNVQDGDIITQVGQTGRGEVQGTVSSENKVVLINVTGTFSSSGSPAGQLEVGGTLLTGSFGQGQIDANNDDDYDSDDGFAIRPTSILTGESLLGSALTKVTDGVYGSTPITTSGSGDSLVRTLRTGDTLTNIQSNLNLGGWINVQGIILDDYRAIDTSGDALVVYTPGKDNSGDTNSIAFTVEGTKPATETDPNEHIMKIPLASLQVGTSYITKDSDNYAGFASSFMQNTSGFTNDTPYMVTPWMFTNYIQAPGELDGTGTGISIGADGRHTTADQIALVVNGDGDALLVDKNKITLGAGGGSRVTVESASTTVLNTLYVKNGANTKFSVANSTGNTRVYGTFQADGNVTLGDSFANDTITINAKHTTDVSPNANNLTLGDSSNVWEELFVKDITQSGTLTVAGTLVINAQDAISFENGKHWITNNDGAGDFNLRIGHYSNGDDVEESTEAGYVFHDEWFQSTGTRQFNVSSASTDVGDLQGTDFAWRTQISYDDQAVTLGWEGTTHLATDTDGVNITGTLDVSNNLNVGGGYVASTGSGATIDSAGNLSINGNLTVDGNIELGDAVTDTITTNAIIADDTLKMKRDQDGSLGFNLVLEKSTASAAVGDDIGVIKFQMNNSASQLDEDAIQASITVNATSVTNSAERSEIVFATASGTATTTNKFTISDEISAAVDFVSSGTNTIGQSDDYWNKAYITTGYGSWQGDILDDDGDAVVIVGTSFPGAADDDPQNYTVFKGEFNGPLTGGVDIADEAKEVWASQFNGTVPNSDHYLTFVPSNLTFANRAKQNVYVDAGIKFNPSTNKVTVGGDIDAGSNTITAGKFKGDIYNGTTLLGDVSDSYWKGKADYVVLQGSNDQLQEANGSQVSADALADGSTNRFFSNTLAQGAFSAGTGITFTNSSGVIELSVDNSAVTASSASEVAVTNTNSDASEWYVTFVSDTGTEELNIDKDATGGLKYVPSSSTLTATIFSGTASQANYADLAEKYVGDEVYEPGTVVVFGGEQEITACTTKGDRKVAGVVSTDPAYLMNNALEGDTVLPLALTGRVPCKVIGSVEKGDMLVTSAVPGYAIVDNDPKLGTVIGKAVGTKDDDGKGVVEVVVGRL
jgi:hypothetical protein